MANQDRTAELGALLRQQAASRRPSMLPPALAPQHSALALRQARNTAEYQSILVNLIRIRRGITTSDFSIPHKPGWKGSLLAGARRFLWKLLRYQHDRMAFQQNVLNELLIGALEFEREQRLAETEALRQRVDALERKQGGAS
ncbi:MAG TPA: hypothetical protein DCZ95_00175 [Verrucomicrobia bacterium]|nr:MAG: hypothetical protein A2X46_13625 [Lentisphaerae bacterium GWF2_57_35]HBA82486.1 hypothetical protein [Verrucomicrobiota bacterium]